MWHVMDVAYGHDTCGEHQMFPMSHVPFVPYKFLQESFDVSCSDIAVRVCCPAVLCLIKQRFRSVTYTCEKLELPSFVPFVRRLVAASFIAVVTAPVAPAVRSILRVADSPADHGHRACLYFETCPNAKRMARQASSR